MTNLTRRGLLGAIICAPAIVRASSLMPIKAMDLDREMLGKWFLSPMPGARLVRYPGHEVFIQYQRLHTDTLRAMLDQSAFTDMIRGAA